MPHARVNEQHFRGDDKLQCLVRGSKGLYLVRGYDKGHELRDRAARDSHRRHLLTAWAAHNEGRLRYELQLRAQLRRRKGMTYVDDLTFERVQALAGHHFEHTRWSEPYGGSARYFGRSNT